MHYIDKFLGNNREKSKVENAVHNVCNHLPKTIHKPCNRFVNKYASSIIDIITKDVSPKQVCSFLGLCTKLIEEMKGI